jgi:hypothetical protein
MVAAGIHSIRQLKDPNSEAEGQTDEDDPKKPTGLVSRGRFFELQQFLPSGYAAQAELARGILI